MPELPEVEIHSRNLRQWLAGRRVVGFEVLDPLLQQGQDLSGWPEALVGRAALGVRRLAKYALADLEGGHTLVIHLRMTGRLVRDTYIAGDVPKFTRFWLDLDDGTRVRFEDRRRFGRVWVARTGEERLLPELTGLGPDAYLEPLDAARLREVTAKSGRAIKVLLMDQAVLGGIGNICAIEILYRTGIHPETRARDLSDAEVDRIARAIPEFLEWAIETQSRRELLYIGEKGAENVFTIYRRDGTACPACGAPIQRIVTGGRGTYFCPGCQPER